MERKTITKFVKRFSGCLPFVQAISSYWNWQCRFSRRYLQGFFYKIKRLYDWQQKASECIRLLCRVLPYNMHW